MTRIAFTGDITLSSVPGVNKGDSVRGSFIERDTVDAHYTIDLFSGEVRDLIPERIDVQPGFEQVDHFIADGPEGHLHLMNGNGSGWENQQLFGYRGDDWYFKILVVHLTEDQSFRVDFKDMYPIPEPASAILLGLALVSIGLMRRWRCQS